MRWFLRNLRVKHWWNYMKPVPFASSGGSWCTCPFISRKLRALSKETYCFFSTALIFFPSFFFFLFQFKNWEDLEPWFFGSMVLEILILPERGECAHHEFQVKSTGSKRTIFGSLVPKWFQRNKMLQYTA